MFLRHREPSVRETRVGRGIRTGHLIGIAVFVAIINVRVAAHLITFGPSPVWVWLQIAAGVLQFVTVGGLIWVIKKSPRRRPSGR
ncbi:hypothetical protein [Curtobacterium sp. RRHDQ10]|uniref:hypothetical protein n=1 Tax=Curtobacterium phyllosphaerae TaxID=3413379 RepID=UPI003BEFC122